MTRYLSFSLAVLAALLLASDARAQSTIQQMPIVGYADRLSVQPGETINFMVSSDSAQYRADIVRLIHGDPDPKGPGFKEDLIASPANKEYPGHHQDVVTGSYVTVSDSPALRLGGSFTLQAWIYPTTPSKGAQGLITKWSAAEHKGYGLVIDEDGSLGLWIGDATGRVEKVRTGKPFQAFRRTERVNANREPLHGSRWYFVAAVFDASAGKITLYQEPVVEWPLEEVTVNVDRSVAVKGPGPSDVPLLLGAFWDRRDGGKGFVGGYYNGKIESPRVFNRALSKQELAALKGGGAPQDAVAAWDFSTGIASRKITDTSSRKLNGETVNMPSRAVIGHDWNDDEPNFTHAKKGYEAIHFHDDDLDDARWDPGFSFKLPDTLKSGVYAARLRGGVSEDYVPFFVRPKRGTATAPIAYLMPTFSYLAYGDSGSVSRDPQGLGLYSHHSDGDGVAYSSRLRPILSIRPKKSGSNGPRHFAADLYLINFMEVKGHKYDIITDEELHAEGASLLAPYKVVITGSHPEYYSTQMLDAWTSYLNNGGRAMYLGGNGFYWVTSLDPAQQHTIEVRRWGGTQAWMAEPGEMYSSFTGEFGGLWRNRGRAPQKLMGIGFTAQGGGRNAAYRRQAGSFDPRAAFIFEGIGPNELIGDFPSPVREYGAAGDELDRYDPQLGSPSHALVLATATGLAPTYVHVVEEVYSSNTGPLTELVKADMVYFEYPKGGAVFSVGSISWDGALSNNDYDNTVARVTDNVLKRFSSQSPVSSGTGPTGNAGK